jgi:hypothetical protein
MVLVSTAIAYPHPRHSRRSASQRVRPALRRGSELTGAFPADVEPAQPGERVCAGHRPAIQQPAERQNTVVFDTPTRYTGKASDRRFRWSEALSRTWWQVKDSNLRSSRDGYTDHGRQRADQRKRLSHNNLRAHSPQTAGDSRPQPDTPIGLEESWRNANSCARCRSPGCAVPYEDPRPDKDRSQCRVFRRPPSGYQSGLRGCWCRIPSSPMTASTDGLPVGDTLQLAHQVGTKPTASGCRSREESPHVSGSKRSPRAVATQTV